MCIVVLVIVECFIFFKKKCYLKYNVWVNICDYIRIYILIILLGFFYRMLDFIKKGGVLNS